MWRATALGGLIGRAVGGAIGFIVGYTRPEIWMYPEEYYPEIMTTEFIMGFWFSP